MDVEEALRFVGGNHRAVMVTYRRDGSPTTSPVTASVDGDGRVVVSTRETAMKVRHVRRDPRALLCVFTDGFYGPWVQVEGRVEVVSLPEAMDGLVAYYRGVAGEHPDWDDYRAAMERERRCLLRMTVQRAGPDRQG
ncbi:PPOX class F420-dependent oxidoreductase [Thalassiella azotivora]